MKLVIEIELGNDAMQLPSDAVVAIQEAFARRPQLVDLRPGDAGRIGDGNGNTVGKWQVEA